jgi:hypothetical protein
MRVDEPGDDGCPVGIEDRFAFVAQVAADLDDAAAVHAHIGSVRRGARTVDDVATTQQ